MNDLNEGEKWDAEELAKATAVEKSHLDNLMGHHSGRWLLRQLVAECEAFENRSPSNNGWDMHAWGKYEVAREYRNLVVKHCGYKALDFLKG